MNPERQIDHGQGHVINTLKVFGLHPRDHVGCCWGAPRRESSMTGTSGVEEWPRQGNWTRGGAVFAEASQTPCLTSQRSTLGCPDGRRNMEVLLNETPTWLITLGAWERQSGQGWCSGFSPWDWLESHRGGGHGGRSEVWSAVAEWR